MAENPKARTRGLLVNRFVAAAVGMGLAAFHPWHVLGADIFYNDTGGDFSAGPSWSGGVAPGPGDSAVFDSGSTLIAIDFIQNNTVDSLQFRDSNVSFDLVGLSLTLQQAPPTGSLVVGDPSGADAAATFTSSKVGAVLTPRDVVVTALPGGTSNLTFTGANLTVNQGGTDQFVLGQNGGIGGVTLSIQDNATVNTGTGTFSVYDNAQVTVASSALLNAAGDVLVDGGVLNSLDGDNFQLATNRSLSVLDGGSVSFSGSGFTTPLNTTLQVSDPGSLVSGAGVTFNLANASQLQISNGGSWVRSLDVETGSTVAVTGIGSTLGRFDVIDGTVALSAGAASSGSSFSVGDFGSAFTGTLNIQADASVTGSSTFDISSSSSDSTGVVNVTGSNALLQANATLNIGSASGSTGTVSLSSGGALNIAGTGMVDATGTIDVGNGGVLNSSGPVTINGGLIEVSAGGAYNPTNSLDITGGTLRVGDQGQATFGVGILTTISGNGLLEYTDLTATVNLDDGNIILIDGAGDLAGTPSMLHAFDNLDVESNTFVSASDGGTIRVDDDLRLLSGGVVSLNNGSLEVADNITVDGGQLQGLSDGDFSWAANKLMTVRNGGEVFIFSGVDFDSADIVVDGAGSQVIGSGVSTDLTNASSVTVVNGGRWTKSFDVVSGSTVLADGPGSQLGGFDVIQGDVTITNGASASNAIYRIGENGGVGTGTLNILNGSTLDSTFIGFSVSNFSTHTDGVVNVDGGSSLTVQDADIGSDAGSIGTVNLTNGSRYIATGDTHLRATGTINIDGSTALLGNYIDDGGTINFTSGTFGHNGDFRVGGGSVVGLVVSTTQRSLVFGGAVTIDANATVNVDGGILSAGSIVKNGVINFTGGKLEITNSVFAVDTGGLLGRTPTIGAGQALSVLNDLNAAAVGVLTVDGGSVFATTLNNSGYVALNGVGSLLDGGALVNDGVLAGSGVVNAPLQNNPAGEVRATAGQELIFTGGGNANQGLVYVDGGIVRFAGSLTNQGTGVITGHGALRFPGGLTNEGDMNFPNNNANIFGSVDNTATGQISVAGGAGVSFFDDVTHNGDTYVGTGSRVVFFGDVSGAGSFSGAGQVEFAGSYSPGLSPAAVSFEGDLSLGGLSQMLIELGGTVAGTEFDQLIIAGTADLGGALEVALINGFVPSSGQVFRIVDAPGISGVFDTVTLPALTGGLTLDIIYDTDGVLLSVIGGLAGDLNGDGFVGINDLNIVLGNWNQNVPPANPLADPSGDGFVGIDDLNAVLGNWNAGTPPINTSASIPEPGTAGMFLVLSAMSLHRRRSMPRRTSPSPARWL